MSDRLGDSECLTVPGDEAIIDSLIQAGRNRRVIGLPEEMWLT